MCVQSHIMSTLGLFYVKWKSNKSQQPSRSGAANIFGNTVMALTHHTEQSQIAVRESQHSSNRTNKLRCTKAKKSLVSFRSGVTLQNHELSLRVSKVGGGVSAPIKFQLQLAPSSENLFSPGCAFVQTFFKSLGAIEHNKAGIECHFLSVGLSSSLWVCSERAKFSRRKGQIWEHCCKSLRVLQVKNNLTIGFKKVCYCYCKFHYKLFNHCLQSTVPRMYSENVTARDCDAYRSDCYIIVFKELGSVDKCSLSWSTFIWFLQVISIALHKHYFPRKLTTQRSKSDWCDFRWNIFSLRHKHGLAAPFCLMC